METVGRMEWLALELVMKARHVMCAVENAQRPSQVFKECKTEPVHGGIGNPRLHAPASLHTTATPYEYPQFLIAYSG